MNPIFATRPDGLGTRLLTFLHARQLAETLGTSMNVMWPPLDDPFYTTGTGLLQNGSFGDIFASENVFQDGNSNMGSLIDFDTIARKRQQFLMPYFNSHKKLSMASFLEESKSYEVTLYDMPFAMPFSDHVADSGVIKLYWNRLAFHEKIRTVFDDICAQYNISEALAVHIRRGDVENILIKSDLLYLRHSGLISIFQRYIPIAAAKKYIYERMAEYETLIVCSEDQGCVEIFRECFPNLDVISSHGIFKTGSNEAALLDLMLLSASKELIAPPQSYFSECAGTVGRCNYFKSPLDVEAVVPELIALIDRDSPYDAPQRRALVYWCGYQNLWWKPELRPLMMELGRNEDAVLMEVLLSESALS